MPGVEITEEEARRELYQLKNGKAAGLSEIGRQDVQPTRRRSQNEVISIHENKGICVSRSNSE